MDNTLKYESFGPSQGITKNDKLHAEIRMNHLNHWFLFRIYEDLTTNEIREILDKIDELNNINKTIFNWTQPTKQTVIQTLDTYFDEYGNSECIAQGTEAQIRAAEIMCEIADIVNPVN